MNDKLEQLYKALKANPNVVGMPDDYAQFASVMSDRAKAEQFYSAIKQNQSIVGLPDTFDLFSDSLGLKKKTILFNLFQRMFTRQLREKKNRKRKKRRR